jgi:hypothetical protein
MADTETAWQLAQLNIARMRAALDHPDMADFVANITRINTLADQADGFVWRLIEDENTANPFGPEWLVNMSVWRDADALKAYVYRSDHGAIMRGRSAWFERTPSPTLVLWWIRAGSLPTLEDGRERLRLLEDRGPTAQAFHFGRLFDAPRVLS